MSIISLSSDKITSIFIQKELQVAQYNTCEQNLQIRRNEGRYRIQTITLISYQHEIRNGRIFRFKVGR